MADSVFTKIIKGEIPCHKIYEDDRTIAILDINPMVEGHVLVIPKRQVEHLWDLTDDDYHYLMSVVKHVASHIKEVLKAPRVGMLVDGYNSPDHCHVHVLPLSQGLEHTVTNHIKASHQEPDHAKLAKMAAKLEL